jgi:hypothetical protein
LIDGHKPALNAVRIGSGPLKVERVVGERRKRMEFWVRIEGKLEVWFCINKMDFIERMQELGKDDLYFQQNG